MCGIANESHRAYILAAQDQHLEQLGEHYPEQRDFSRRVRDLLAERMIPHLGLVVLFTDLFAQLRTDQRSWAHRTWGSGTVLTTYSTIDIGRRVRYQTPNQRALHDLALGLHMSAGTLSRLHEELMRRYGVTHYSFHSCGDIFRETELPSLDQDPTLLAIERFRTALDAVQAPVIAVEHAHQVPSSALGWSAPEHAADARVRQVVLDSSALNTHGDAHQHASAHLDQVERALRIQLALT
jgi:hypothetical protein